MGRDLGLPLEVRLSQLYNYIQLRALSLTVFFGVGVCHSKVSLMMEADAFPVHGLACEGLM